MQRRVTGNRMEASRAPKLSYSILSGVQRTASLQFRLGGDRKSAAIAKRLGRDLDSRGSLLTFVLAAFDHVDHALHQIQIEIVGNGNLLRRPRFLDIVFEDRVE